MEGLEEGQAQAFVEEEDLEVDYVIEELLDEAAAYAEELERDEHAAAGAGSEVKLWDCLSTVRACLSTAGGTGHEHA